MTLFDKIRIKAKICKMCFLMCRKMNRKDVMQSAQTIKSVWYKLPQDRKEGLIDVCLKVLKNGKEL